MTSSGSMNKYISEVVHRYSSLISFPSHKIIVTSLFIVCTFGGLVVLAPFKLSYLGLYSGLFFGLTFFFVVLSTDLIVYLGCMKNDPIFNLRRCSTLSLFSCLIWFFFIFLGSVTSALIGNSRVWFKIFLIGFSVVLAFRLLLLSLLSFASDARRLFSALFQPILCSIPLFFMREIIGYSLDIRLFLLSMFSSLIALSASSLFVFFLNKFGEKKLGIASNSLLTASLASWMENVNDPLESVFEKVGHERDIRISLLAFKAKKKIKAIMVVPTFHPGPFKNVGSSLLPNIIQVALEKKFGCVASVPHGISGHGLNLTSRTQNKKIVEAILKSTAFSTNTSGVTPFLRAQRDGAKASCQILGDYALVTLTTAPQIMEDLPTDLDRAIMKDAKKRGLLSAIVIDAHNSIKEQFTPNVGIDNLRKAALDCIEMALLQSRCVLEIGAAKVIPREFSVEDGMGPGGISVLVMKVKDQKTAYVTIDGNNMMSGLREKILLMLREIGIVDGEILTTDTHVVNGVILTKRGYHPIGEVINQSKLIDYVKEATITALKNMEPAAASCSVISIPKIKVIGEEMMGTMCSMVEVATRLTKKLSLSIFTLAGIFLTIFFVIF